MRKYVVCEIGSNELPQRIDEKVLEQMVQALREGDSDQIQPIINGHIRLAVSLAARYAKREPESMVSAALFGLCQAVNWAPERLHDNNITPYIISTIRRYLYDNIKAFEVVHYPKGKEAAIVEYCSDVNTDYIYEGDDEVSGEITKVVYDDPYLVDEVIGNLNLRKEEEQALRLKMEGMNHREIGERIGTSTRLVSYMFEKIALRATAKGYHA